MSATCVIGLQWGDEAKGKIVDWLTQDHDVIIRYNGGSNAGHTVVKEQKTYKFSLVPTGVLWPNRVAVLGCGVVIHPKALIQEIESLKSNGCDPESSLKISDRAHVIFPYHFQEEQLAEQASQGQQEAIGNSLRVIGPCYADKVGRRHAIRLGELANPQRFHDRLVEIVEFKNRYIQSIWPESQALNPDAIFEEYCDYFSTIEPYVTDTTALLHQLWDSGKNFLFEGAQGSLLDIDHGTYPYVTSSNSSVGGIASGTGIPTSSIDECVGIIKAYTTRVGGGPFPTELHDSTGDLIRKTGKEFGTVTGRPRRCGWFDAVAARYTTKLNGVDVLSVMLLDVLSELDELKICTAYEYEGDRIEQFPSSIDILEKCTPVYQTLPGWRKDIQDIRTLTDLPSEARHYLDTITACLKTPIKLVSVGPDREQTIPIV